MDRRHYLVHLYRHIQPERIDRACTRVAYTCWCHPILRMDEFQDGEKRL